VAEPARRPLEHLRELLQREAGASGGGCFLILTHRSPDPDALGACCGLRHLLENGFGMDTRVATVGRIQRAENVAMVRELGLFFEDYHKVDLGGVTGTLLVDSQPGFGHTEVPEGLPLLAVFDHHVTPEAVRDALAAVPHVDVRPDVGATSSIVYE
jgi:nanoRNase/pAp phosphatase (c-di-AMP/oligoRNAs hydrolase)